METLRTVVGWLVVVIGLVGWMVFIPQISLLIKTKNSQPVSLSLVWGSIAMQAILLLHVLLQAKVDWRLSITYITSLSCLAVLVSTIYYYRRFPGGR
jgi:uncharacterized protein with PQ loop repeat